jgi:hypothetical protein
MSKLRNIALTIAAATTGLLGPDRAPLLALLWVLLNLALGGIAVHSGYPNAGALLVGALDGFIFSSLVLVKASARLEAGMTGLLSGFGLDSITNSGRVVARLVHGIHEGLEAIVSASTDGQSCDHHQVLELMVMRAIWMAVAVVLLALFVKWGRSQAVAASAQPAPALVHAPAEIPRAA